MRRAASPNVGDAVVARARRRWADPRAPGTFLFHRLLPTPAVFDNPISTVRINPGQAWKLGGVKGGDGWNTIVP